MAEKKQAYLQKLEGRMREWNAKLDQLRAKAQQASADVKIRYQGEIDALKAKRDELEAQLKRLRDVSEAKFEEARAKAEVAWADLRTRLELAMAKLK